MHEYDDDRTYQFVLNLFLVASSRSRTEVSAGYGINRFRGSDGRGAEVSCGFVKEK